MPMDVYIHLFCDVCEGASKRMYKIRVKSEQCAS